MNWQPIATAPRDGTWIILEGEFAGGDTSTALVGRWEGGVYPWVIVLNEPYFDCGPISESQVLGSFVEDRVYHWMPLPPPPTEQTSDTNSPHPGNGAGSAEKI